MSGSTGLQFAFEPARDAIPRKMLNRLGFLGTDRLYTAALTRQGPSLFLLPASAGASAVRPEIVRDEGAGETRYRFAIPWRELGGQPASGAVLGFTLLVADTDWDGRMFQYRLEWGHGIDGPFHDPTRLLPLILE